MGDKTLNELKEIIMKLAEEKGFGTKPEDINVGEKIALLHTEISEAYEAYRKKNMDGKDGFREELSDIIHRTLHLAGVFDIDIEKELLDKIAYNKGRTWSWKNMNESHVGLEKKNKGFFVVIEGTDGTGKATQAGLLIEKLRKQGREVHLMDFPQYGKNVFSRAVESYLRDEYGDAMNVNPYLASFTYAGDRGLMRKKIKELLDKGAVIVSNRYTSASMGHQGAKIKDKDERRRFLAWLKELEWGEEGYNMPAPDMTFLLYLNPEISQKMVDKKDEREYTRGEKRDAHENNLGHLQEAAKTFLEIADEEKNWEVIDCEDKESGWILDRELISDKIWGKVRERLIE